MKVRSDRIAAGLAYSVHLAAVAHFTPRGFLSMPLPFLTSAFAVNAYRADRTLRALAATARWSSYDPQVLAGQVAGLFEPLGSRAVVLVTVLLARAGVASAPAFDGVVVALHALYPLVGYLASRISGASQRVATCVLALWSALGFLDALTHYAWFSGRIELVVSSALAVLEVALGARALADRRWGAAVGAALTGVVATLMHPLPALLAAATLVVAAARARPAPNGLRAAIAALVAAPALAVLVLGSRGAVTSEPLTSVFGNGPSSLFWDLVEIPAPGYGAAGGSRTMLRMLCAGGALLAWRRSPRSFGALGAFAAAALGLAYLGALVPVKWPLDPYFFAIAAAFATSLPAVELVVSLPWGALVRTSAREVRVALLVAGIIAVPRAVRTVLTYAPELLPARVVRGPSDFAVSALGGIDEPFPDPLGYDPPPPSLAVIADYLIRNGAARGRVLTDDATVAAYLALATPLPVVGPLGVRGAASSSSDPTSLLERDASEGEVRDFVERNAVSFVVLAGRRGVLDAPGAAFGDPFVVAGYRVRRALREPSVVAAGTTRDVGATARAIAVRGAAGESLTLRYHFVSGMTCSSACKVERDATGFITVRNPPQDFEIAGP